MVLKTSYRDLAQAKETLQSPSQSSLKMESLDSSIFYFDSTQTTNPTVYKKIHTFLFLVSQLF